MVPSPYQPTTTPKPSLDRITSDEKKLLEVFKNTALLKVIRKVFYQDELTEEQATLIKSIPPSLSQTLKKLFLPSIDNDWDSPIFNQGSRWMDKQFADLPVNEVRSIVVARQKALKFITNGVQRLINIINGNPDATLPLEVDLRMETDYETVPTENVKIAVASMQDSLRLLESTLLVLEGYANSQEESPEQVAERKRKDSTK